MFKFSRQPSISFVSFLNAAGVFAYVSAVSWLLFSAGHIFGNVPEPNFLIPIYFLLLFVISASITGFLVLGKPILMYWDGQKKEALKMLFCTLAWLVLFLFLVVIALLVQ